MLLHHTLQQDKFEDADFKYGNSIFKFQPKNTKIKYFCLRTFILHQTLQLDKFEGVDFKYGNDFFEFQSENNKAVLC